MADIFLLYAAKQKEGGLIENRERESLTININVSMKPFHWWRELRHCISIKLDSGLLIWESESSAGQGSHFLSKMRVHVGHFEGQSWWSDMR